MNAAAKDNGAVEIRRLADCTFREAVELWNIGFSGYYSDMTMSMEKYVARLGAYAIRPDLSVAAFVGGEPAGFVLVGLKTADGVPIAWNGGTGVSPNHRGKGIAKRLMREAVAAMKEAGARIALLEVVQKNAGAIAAYESAGFRIRDGLIGAKRSGAIAPAPPSEADNLAAGGYTVGSARPAELKHLPFFRHEAAWSGQWFNRLDDPGVVIRDAAGTAAAYALARRTFDEESGRLTGIALFQCAADPSRPDRRTLVRAAMEAAFGPLDTDCVRQTDNLSMSDPAATEWLEEAGFETVYTQYLMTAEL